MLLSHDPAKIILEVVERAREVRGAVDAGERNVSDLEPVCRHDVSCGRGKDNPEKRGLVKT